MPEERENQTPGTDNVGDEGSEGKNTSIEKFKTGEERDKAYLELEKQARSRDQEVADLRDRVDQLASLKANSGNERNGEDKSFSETYKSEEELRAFWQRFAAHPQEVFKEVTEAAEKRAIGAAVDAMRGEMLAREAIQDFKRNNPDLAEHDKLMEIFVRDIDPKLPPQERLNKAAPEARKYLTELAKGKGSQESNEIDTDAYVESPSGSRDSGRKVAPKEPSEEDEVVASIKEHSKLMEKKQLPPRIK